MIDLRREQRSFGEGFIQETVEELWEDWSRTASDDRGRESVDANRS